MMAGGAMMEAARGPGGASVPVAVPVGPGPSLPGVLHFIQQEWGRFEAERSRWEAERAELQAQVVALQGECRGGQRSRSELLRRLRMLEAALALERAKCHKLRPDGDLAAPERAEAAAGAAPDGPAKAGAAAWPEGRHVLRQYLRDASSSSTGSDRHSRRLRSLLASGAEEPGSPPAGASGASGASLLVRRIEEQIQRNAGREPPERAGTTFPAPGAEDEDSDEDEDAEAAGGSRPAKKQRGKPGEDEDEADDADSEDALGEFDFVGAGSRGGRDDAPGSWSGAARAPEPDVGTERPGAACRSGAASQAASQSGAVSQSGYPILSSIPNCVPVRIPDPDT